MVRDALRSHIEGEDREDEEGGGGGMIKMMPRSVIGDDQDGAETAMRVFKAGGWTSFCCTFLYSTLTFIFSSRVPPICVYKRPNHHV